MTENYSVVLTQYGFDWGPMTVTRCLEYRGYVTLQVKSIAGPSVDVYISPKGRSLRVFGRGGELFLPKYPLT